MSQLDVNRPTSYARTVTLESDKYDLLACCAAIC